MWKESKKEKNRGTTMITVVVSFALLVGSLLFRGNSQFDRG